MADTPEEEMSVESVMRHTGAPRNEAVECVNALSEAQAAFNVARRANQPTVTIKRRTLWRLATLAAATFGMENLGG